MGKTVTAREQRCALFVQALAGGVSVSEACKASGIVWASLYRWRREDSQFRAAWDDAARAGADIRATEFEAELRRRAVAGVDDPVFHAGAQVGTRKRYSDALLMFALRELRHRRRPDAEPPPAPAPAGEPRVTVVIREFGPPQLARPTIEEKAKSDG